MYTYSELGSEALAVLEHPELMEFMLPLLRAVSSSETPTSRSRTRPSAVRYPPFGGLDDPETPKEDPEAWSQVTGGTFELRMLPGDHFYLSQEPLQPIQAMIEDLARGV